MRTVALGGGGYTTPDPILSPGVRNFLEGSKFGRLGLQAGRKARQLLRRLRDPVQHKVWIRQFALPLRNAILLNRPLEISIDGILVYLAPRGGVAGDISTGLRGEQRDLSFFLNVLDPTMIFFDIGANAGLFAIAAAKKVGGMEIFAFEPCSWTCRLLKRNLLLNRLADINVIQTALGDSVGEGVLQINARGRDGLNTLGQSTHPDRHVVGQEKVRVTTLDVFINEHKVPRVDVIKVDVQGAELMVFRGAQNLLERADAPIILFEGYGYNTRRFGYHPVEILWFLESCGYTLFSFHGETGEISELKPEYQYNSMVIAAKPGHLAYAKLQAGLK
jgi:FkbM family methyltransferase